MEKEEGKREVSWLYSVGGLEVRARRVLGFRIEETHGLPIKYI